MAHLEDFVSIEFFDMAGALSSYEGLAAEFDWSEVGQAISTQWSANDAFDEDDGGAPATGGRSGHGGLGHAGGAAGSGKPHESGNHGKPGKPHKPHNGGHHGKPTKKHKPHKAKPSQTHAHHPKHSKHATDPAHQHGDD
jgi:hypothetical protein